jgi:hypothetical protein
VLAGGGTWEVVARKTAKVKGFTWCLSGVMFRVGFEVWSRVWGLGFAVSGYGFEFSG